jgi:RHS repeat-associated protein
MVYINPRLKLVVIITMVISMICSPLLTAFAEEMPAVVTAPVQTDPTVNLGTDQTAPTSSTQLPSGSTGEISQPSTVTPTDSTVVPTDAAPVIPDTDTKAKDKVDKKQPAAKVAAAATTTTGSAPPTNVDKSVSRRLNAVVDDATGALTYSYDISVPPGRNGMTPDISLSYNSNNANRDSIIGSGWDISIPSIERINKTGSNSMYSETYFVSSMDGELVSLGSNNYAAKNENGSFNTYSLVSNVWTVKDKSGTVYKFGNTAAARQDNSADTSKVFKWMLEEERDTNDNYVKYIYFKDAGQIYPSQIVYTGNGTTDGVLEVNFDRTARTGAPKSFTPGFSVQNNYRITEIRTEVNNTWATKYTLAYTTGDNASGSLLNTIIEAGQDDSSNLTTLPATDFNYSTAATDWTYNSSWNLPLPFQWNGAQDRGMRTGDINGDGLPDVLCHNDSSTGGPCYRNAPEVYLNNGDGTFTDVSSTWLFPLMGGTGTKREHFTDGSYIDVGLRLIDVNGDLKADLVRGQGSVSYVYINNGSGWTYDPSWVLPRTFFVLSGQDYGMRMNDINGDGLPDIVCHNDATAGSCSRNQPEIYLNNGSGWTDVSSTWLLPIMADNASKREAFTTSDGYDRGLRIQDVNGDGLADLVRGDGPSKYTYINNGSGWTYDANWAMPLPFINGFNDSGVRFSDFNGDGLVDILCHTASTSGGSCDLNNPLAYLNTGTGWTDVSTAWIFPPKAWDASKKEIFLDSTYKDDGLRIMDINGDGMDDLVRGGCSSGCLYTYLNNESRLSNLLTEIVHPQGGDTDITYKATPLFKNGSTLLNPNMPIISHVVSQITNNDGLGLASTQTYSYEGGLYYFNNNLDRKFAGFNKVTKTNASGNKVVNYFHQGNTTDTSNGEYSDHSSKIGKLYRSEVKDSAGNIYSISVNKWDRYDLGGGRSFVKNVRTTGLTYDGDSDHKDKAEEYVYDNTYGNLTSKTEWGEVTASNDGSFTDTGTDKFVTTTTYAANTGAYIVGLPSQDTKVDQSAVKVAENKYYYDLQALGGVTDGNLTKQEMWKTGSTYIDVEKTYNTTYGLVTSEKDPRDITTNYSYDAYNLYPVTVTNALSEATSYTYDYSSGQVKQITDPNTRVYQNVYDGLDRLLEQKQPDLTTPATLVTKALYVYTDTSGAVKVKKTDYLDGSTSVDSYTYFDGLARPIQSRTEMEDANTFAVTDTIYNNNGDVYKQSLPYASTGSSKTSATTTASLLTINAYDAMSRVVSTTNAVGSTSNAYDDWKLTITDPRGKLKDLYNDAYGNLVRVDEHNGASTYTTTYNYNGNNNLTKITDALSNIRNFTYDGLGRQLTAQDLHAPADVTFGTWTYTYDDSGNRTSVLDPKSQTINYTYDDLNRVATEDYTGQVGTEVTYTYDSGTDGIGRLTSVNATGANSSYVYNPLGGISSETKTINSTGYTTSYTYDRLGNQLEITNPDSSKVKYTYNTAGQLETIQRKESTDGAFINVVTDYDYGPQGSVTYQADTNGSASTNTYDATKLYRLSNKTTTITGGTKVQDLTYTYDANGNITKIVDASNTNGSKTVDYTYDDLNRLLSATASAVAAGQSTYTHSYSYDAIGNILTRTDAAGTYSYSGSGYANPHAVTSVGSVNYTYDNNGNMLTETSGLSNTWDYGNRITQVVKTGVTSTYGYDHSGQRVKLANGTTTTYYPSAFYNTDGVAAMKHITTPGGQEVATVKGTGGSAAVYYDHGDQLGSSSAITNSAGTLEELMDYFPYGNIRLDQKAGSYSEQRKYTGHEYDVDTGLSYMEARYYNPSIGRFLSQDPVYLAIGNNDQIKLLTKTELTDVLSDPQGLNSYSYARNNPLRYVDPDGKFFREKWEEAKEKANQGVVWVGNKAEQAYQNNAVARYALDHPYQAGAAIGVVGGALVAGGVVAGGGAITCGVLCGGTAATVAGTAAPVAQQAQKNQQQIMAAGNRTLNLTQHALARMTERGISQQQITNIAQKGQAFDYIHEGVSKIGYYDPVSKVLVATVRSSGNITTVIRNVSQSYVNGLIQTVKK